MKNKVIYLFNLWKNQDDERLEMVYNAFKKQISIFKENFTMFFMSFLSQSIVNQNVCEYLISIIYLFYLGNIIKMIDHLKKSLLNNKHYWGSKIVRPDSEYLNIKIRIQ